MSSAWNDDARRFFIVSRPRRSIPEDCREIYIGVSLR
jgi:hypothetical protein